MPTRFTVRVTPSFQRDLEGLPLSTQERVLEAVKRLDANPFGPPSKIKKLKGKGVGQWRLEVWPYRVRYDVIGQDVILYRVRHRKEIYHD
ncbi:MAG: type II toxin-antitoxin system RelE/ParE family toxin [candidate division NC10 bacterium]|nr:type II toxin-antitoxin system RelE/ParE family toxin [candidate division NC10 bacterium]MDE2485459.1 type II toxin-antitoxin system RelE/ParE family toxin [candidate division NC10 bacterium]